MWFNGDDDHSDLPQRGSASQFYFFYLFLSFLEGVILSTSGYNKEEKGDSALTSSMILPLLFHFY